VYEGPPDLGEPRGLQPLRQRRQVPSAVVRTAVRAIGRVLITVGLLIILFVGYQLWGTAIWEARAQSDLEGEFERELARAEPDTTTTTAPTTTTTTTIGPTTAPTTTTTTTPRPPPVVPPPGDPIGVIRIDKIGVDKVVVEGTTVPDLRKGPGHYEGSPLPGQLGNAAIAGHRTTYGAPFGDLDQLARGDTLFVQTLTGTWRYQLMRDPFEVDPSQVEVLDPVPGQATLTLTTCHPKYSAAKRLIVQAELTGNQQPAPAPDTQPRLVLDTGLSGGGESRWPTILWGFIAAAVGGLWWLMFHRYPRWTTWLGGAIPFLAVLFVFYTYLERVLPNNY
jgi:sortase A